MGNYNYEEAEVLPYRGNEELIEEFFGAIFFFEKEGAIDRLRKFSELIGGGPDECLQCCFAAEFSPDEDDYFGETGVWFDLTGSFVDGVCCILLTNQEFYDVTERNYKRYAQEHPESREEILRLLGRLKERLEI